MIRSSALCDCIDLKCPPLRHLCAERGSWMTYHRQEEHHWFGVQIGTQHLKNEQSIYDSVSNRLLASYGHETDNYCINENSNKDNTVTNRL